MNNNTTVLGTDIVQADAPEWLAEPYSWRGFITAEDARKFLDCNIEPQVGEPGSNRRSSIHRIQYFADVILNNEWQFNHQGIAFDTDGFLIDGAHRLKGLLLAAETDPDVEIPIIVWYNMPDSSTIDVVRSRSIADVLTQKGYANSNVLAAMARLCYLYDQYDFNGPWSQTYWASSRPRRDVVFAWIAEHRDLTDEAVRSGSQLHKLLTPTGAAAGYYVCKLRFPDIDMETFMRGLKDGADLPAGDPRLALRNWALNRRADGGHSVGFEHMAVFIKAFNAWRTGRSIRMMHWRPAKENFPQP